jgi:predicted MFS family arabinose efflux permease
MTNDEGKLRVSETESAIQNLQSEIGNPISKILGVSMIARLAHDIAVRMVYPFLPEIADGLRVPINQVGAMLSLRSAMGIVSPLFGALSDRVGHRRLMSIGLVALAIGLGIIGAAEGPLAAITGFAWAGIGTAMYLPSLQAYISERVPYARRGRAMGAIELTWAAAGMVGVPALGGLIGPLGWRAPFLALAASVLVCAMLTLFLPETPPAIRAHREPVRLASILRNRSAVAFLIMWMLMVLSFENIQVGYASWFEQQFGLTTSQRGLAQTMFGVFEIAASAGSSLFLDRIGKKRGVTGGLIVMLLGFVLLVTIAPLNLTLGLSSMGVAFLGHEFSIVSGIPIMSEQVPEARRTMLALGMTTAGLGRMLGSICGSALLVGSGFTAAALVSVAVAVVTVAIFARGVHERAAL